MKKRARKKYINKKASSLKSSSKKPSLRKQPLSSSRRKKSLKEAVREARGEEIIRIKIPPLGEKERVEVSKFTTIETTPKEVPQYRLPLQYFDDRIVLLPRDPWWIHTYWDISQAKIDNTLPHIPLHLRESLRWTLRVYDVTGINFTGTNAHSFFDVDIHFEAGNWYINVNIPEREWCVEIGFKSLNGDFFPLVRSNRVKTPYFGISESGEEEWVLPEEEYYRILGIYDLGRSSLERRKRLEEALRYQVSSGLFSGGISSLFSQQLYPREKREFFLEVWTEVILYGRTTPDALVTVSGKKINLRQDGTFSLRYALPEGDFRFEVVGLSGDKKDTIRVVPAVKRYTEK